MKADATSRTAEILHRMQRGEEEAASELLPLVYDELRKLANYRMQRMGNHQSLQPTDLVHEVYLKLVRTEDRAWQNRRHFFNAAGTAMRSILVDRLRRKASEKHGADRAHEPIDEYVEAFFHKPEETLAVDEALKQLEKVDKRAAQVVTLRFFLGLSEPEVADILALSDRTVRRDWVFARSWLGRVLAPT